MHAVHALVYTHSHTLLINIVNTAKAKQKKIKQNKNKNIEIVSMCSESAVGTLTTRVCVQICKQPISHTSSLTHILSICEFNSFYPSTHRSLTVWPHIDTLWFVYNYLLCVFIHSAQVGHKITKLKFPFFV